MVFKTMQSDELTKDVSTGRIEKRPRSESGG